MDDGKASVSASGSTRWWSTGRRVGAVTLAVCAAGAAIAVNRSRDAGHRARTVVRVEAPVVMAAPEMPLAASTTSSATTVVASGAKAPDAVIGNAAPSPAYNSGSPGIAGIAGIGGLPPIAGKLDALFTTRAADRYDVRAFMMRAPIFSAGGSASPPGAQPTPPAWTAPAYCQPSGAYILEVSDAAMVGTVEGSYYDELRWGPVASVRYIGVAEGAPALVAVGQLGAGDALTIVLTDGRKVALTARDGLAYAVVPLDPSSALAELPVSAWEVTNGGKTATTTQSPWGVGPQYGSPPAECVPPPPPLPAPGEQPVDVDTARAAVAAAVSAVFTGKTDESTLMNLIDDPHDLPAVRDALLAGGFAAQVRDAKVEVGEMVFTAPDRAAVRITIVVSLGRFDSVSEVRLVEGTWKVARASYCAAVNLAGVECPA